MASTIFQKFSAYNSLTSINFTISKDEIEALETTNHSSYFFFPLTALNQWREINMLFYPVFLNLPFQ